MEGLKNVASGNVRCSPDRLTKDVRRNCKLKRQLPSTYGRQFIFPPEVGPNGENLGQTFTLPEVATDKNLEELVDDGANAYDDVICFEIIGGKRQQTTKRTSRGKHKKNIWLDLVLLRSFVVEGNELNFLNQQQQQDHASASSSCKKELLQRQFSHSHRPRSANMTNKGN